MATSTKAELPPENSQNMALLEVGKNNLQEELSIDHGALIVSSEHLSQKQNQIISTYTVKKGDTLESIAKMFSVSVNTVLWSNDITKKDVIKEGQMLVILPITGVSHTVKRGDTIQSIAKQYKSDPDETLSFNALSGNSDLKIGDSIIIPDGEITPVVKIPIKPSGGVAIKTGGSLNILKSASPNLTDPGGYFIRPVPAGTRRSQGLHGNNGVDMASKLGTPITAAAAGTVIISKNSGYNGGYGLYVVVAHPNGMQTLYGHLSQVLVNVGEKLKQGEVLGKMGQTGKSTGVHLHFEVRGGKNPF